MNNKPVIIPRTASRWQTHDWQNALKSMNITLADLLAQCDIESEPGAMQSLAGESFPLKVPPHYLRQIIKGDKNDPLLRQILPISLEIQPEQNSQVLTFNDDPLEEKKFNPIPGLIHKYHGRVLLIANPSCVIHCRYCFRRHFDYQDNTPNKHDREKVIAYIQNDPTIHEVILSGGDPLSSNDKQIAQLITHIEAIPHVQTLRMHTRIPSTMPERITNEFLNILKQTRLKVVMVLHINHAQEISSDVEESVALIQHIGIRVLNQSVLLAGVNDSAQILSSLYFKLHELDIQAYYLHMLDKVNGAAHFLVNDDHARAIYSQLQATMPGYMLPKLAREEANYANKSLISVN